MNIFNDIFFLLPWLEVLENLKLLLGLDVDCCNPDHFTLTTDLIGTFNAAGEEGYKNNFRLII